MKKYTTEELVQAKPTPAEFKNIPRNPLSIVLDDLRSLQNVGLFFRLADAFRIEKLYCCGITSYPPLPKGQEARPPNIVEHAAHQITKTAIQIVPFVPWEYQKNTVQTVRRLQQNHTVYAVELTDASIPYTDIAWKFPAAFVFGHERGGISIAVLKAANVVISIPMYGMGNSHNVGIAAGIILAAAVQTLPHPRPLGK